MNIIIKPTERRAFIRHAHSVGVTVIETDDDIDVVVSVDDPKKILMLRDFVASATLSISVHTLDVCSLIEALEPSFQCVVIDTLGDYAILSIKPTKEEL